MALNWAALADEIDLENAQAKPPAFSPLGSPLVASSLARLTCSLTRRAKSPLDRIVDSQPLHRRDPWRLASENRY